MKKLPILLAVVLTVVCTPALAQTGDVPLPQPRPDRERLRDPPARATYGECKVIPSWANEAGAAQHAVIKCAPPDGRSVAPTKDPSP
jgi:hypothetical protein